MDEDFQEEISLDGKALQDMNKSYCSTPPSSPMVTEYYGDSPSLTATWFSNFSPSSRVKITILLTVICFSSSSIDPSYYPIISYLSITTTDSLSMIGISSYLPLLAAALTAGFWESLSHRWSRKWVLVLSLSMASITTLLTAFSIGPIYFSLGRTFTAIFTSAIYPCCNNIIQDIYPPTERAKASSIFVGCRVVVVFVVPLLSSLVVDMMDGWRVIFMTLSLLFLILTPVTVLGIPTTIDKSKREWRNPYRSVFKLLGKIELLSVSVLACMEASSMSFIYIMIAFYFPEEYEIGVGLIGYLYSLIGVFYIIGTTFGIVYIRVVGPRMKFSKRLFFPIFLYFVLSVATFFVGFSFDMNFWGSFCMILLCSLLRGIMVPQIVGYCVELKSIDSSQYTVMISFIIAERVSVIWSFGSLSILMLLCSLPSLFFLCRRLITKSP